MIITKIQQNSHEREKMGRQMANIKIKSKNKSNINMADKNRASIKNANMISSAIIKEASRQKHANKLHTTCNEAESKNHG